MHPAQVEATKTTKSQYQNFCYCTGYTPQPPRDHRHLHRHQEWRKSTKKELHQLKKLNIIQNVQSTTSIVRVHRRNQASAQNKTTSD